MTVLNPENILIVLQCLNMPDQIIDPEEKQAMTFVSDNGLIEDPVEEMQFEAKLRPWSEEEKRIFNDKCTLYYKVCSCTKLCHIQMIVMYKIS